MVGITKTYNDVRVWYVCSMSPLWNVLSPTIIGSENTKQNRLSPLWCRNPRKVLASLVLFNGSEENVLFEHSASPLPRVIASRHTGHHQTWKAYAPPSWQSSLPGLRGVGGLCLEVSFGTWGPDPVMCQCLRYRTGMRSYPIRKQ